MAGDWIKMRVDLGDDPAVVLIASVLDISQDEAVGKLHRLWSWADRHTTNGRAPAITAKWVDWYAGTPGLADAMCRAGWLSFDEGGIVFPNFDRHNGKSAKQRADAALRQRLSRNDRDKGVTGERNDRDKGVTGDSRSVIPRPFTRFVFERDAYTCVFCGEKSDANREASRKAKLSIDHLTPGTRGGGTVVENLACCCRACNNEKNDRTPEEWGVVPTHLQPGITYESGRICVTESCDKPVTREEKRREEKRKPKDSAAGAAARVARPPDELFDAVAEVTASDPHVSGSHVGKLRHLLAKADPPYTPADVREFGRRFAEFCPWAAEVGRDRPTLGELEKNVGKLRASPGPRGPPGKAGAGRSNGQARDSYVSTLISDALEDPP